jgi:hypothetical protein
MSVSSDGCAATVSCYAKLLQGSNLAAACKGARPASLMMVCACLLEFERRWPAGAVTISNCADGRSTAPKTNRDRRLNCTDSLFRRKDLGSEAEHLSARRASASMMPSPFAVAAVDLGTSFDLLKRSFDLQGYSPGGSY